MPDDYELCDDCLIGKYLPRFRYEYASGDDEGLGSRYYSEEDVISALRKAEKGGEK